MQIVHNMVSPQAGNEGTPPVLIVDDDVAIRKMLVEALSLEGFHTETARNGREALEVLQQGKRWIILLDLMMPVMDGW